MALVELSHSGTVFASVNTPEGSVILNTKSKLISDYVEMQAHVTDQNLTPENIRKNVSIFGVTGALDEKNVQQDTGAGKATNSTSFIPVGGSITVSKTGIYNAQWFHYAYETDFHSSTMLYKNGAAVGTEKISTRYDSQNEKSATENYLSLAEGDVLQVRAKTKADPSSWTIAGGLWIREV